MKDYELVRLSKRMSYALRHRPDEFGLELSSDGSVEIGRLIEGINRTTSSEYTFDDIIAVMRMPGKKRFFLKDGRIAAYYGHTTEREVVRMEIAPPSVLYLKPARRLHLLSREKDGDELLKKRVE